LPIDLAGQWKRGTLSSVSEIPPVISQLYPEESIQTTYTGGPGTVTLRAFRMPSETSAFELIQKWPQSQGLAAYKGPYFFIASGDGAADLLRQLQSSADQ
jgi:hypothetical protein